MKMVGCNGCHNAYSLTYRLDQGPNQVDSSLVISGASNSGVKRKSGSQDANTPSKRPGHAPRMSQDVESVEEQTLVHNAPARGQNTISYAAEPWPSAEALRLATISPVIFVGVFIRPRAEIFLRGRWKADGNEYISLADAPKSLANYIIAHVDKSYANDFYIRDGYNRLFKNPEDHLPTDSCIESARNTNKSMRYQTEQDWEPATACECCIQHHHSCVRLLQLANSRLGLATYPMPRSFPGTESEAWRTASYCILGASKS